MTDKGSSEVAGEQAPPPNTGSGKAAGVDAIAYLLKSALLGPIRQLIPAALNIILVPIIIVKGGLVAVGYWGIVNLVTSAFLFADGGAAQYLSRSISSAARPAAEVRTLAETIVSAWLLLTAGLMLLTVLLANPLLTALQLPTGAAGVAGVIVLLSTGFFSLVANLYVFKHIAISEIHFAQIVDIVVAVLQFVIAVTLLQFIDPFLALASAIGSRYLVQCVILHVKMYRKRIEALPRRVVWPRRSRLLALFSAAKGFAAVNISAQLIEITQRSSMLFLAGAPALGLFEIARRGPTMVEQSFTNGMRALFALFSATEWNTAEGQAEAHRMLQWTYRFLTLSSIAGLAALITLAGPIVGLWLNIREPNLVLAMQLFAFHNAVRMINVPTYWMAQARGAEGPLSLVYAGQVCGLLICLFAASRLMTVSFIVVAIIITVMYLAVEVGTMTLCQIRFRYLNLVVQRRGDVAPFLVAAVLLATGWLVAAPPMTRAGSILALITHAALYAPVFAVCALVLFRDRVRSIYGRIARQIS